MEPEYIEREAAMRAARHAWGKGLEPSQYIEIIPAADVAPVVHGYFVHDGPRFAGGVDWWHCSNCGRLTAGVETRFAFCPNCGARMDGGSKAG